jgi:hypothetical protein
MTSERLEILFRMLDKLYLPTIKNTQRPFPEAKQLDLTHEPEAGSNPVSQSAFPGRQQDSDRLVFLHGHHKPLQSC